MPGANQLHEMRENVNITYQDLLEIPNGDITEGGVRSNICIGIQYLEAWLSGNGCVPLYYLMEDAATAEISRAQLWQWIHHKAKLNDGRKITSDRFKEWLFEELNNIESEIGVEKYRLGKFHEASDLFSEMILKDEFDEFLTIPAYNLLK